MAVKAVTRKQWTFMVYLAGDNNLDANGLKDLAEMKTVGSSDDINLLAQFDRAGADRKTKRYFLHKGTPLAKDAVLQLGETNTGSPDALVDFIRWSVKNYPAERYALVLWNHGGGWDDTDVYADERLRAIHRPARGHIRHTFFLSNFQTALKQAAGGAKPRAILYDDDAKDFLDNIEMKKVLAAAQKAAGHKIDILGMDACLMSMAEVACQVRSSVRYTVGSEQTEPLDGWPYHTVLACLAKKPDMETEKFSSVIVGKYIASYPSSEPVTQSAFDLSKSAMLMKAVKELADGLCAELDKEAVQLAVMQARMQVQSYEVPDNIDLVDFCKLLMKKPAAAGALSTACQGIINAVCGPEGIIVKSGCKGASVNNSHGAAIYFPVDTPSPLYAKLDFSRKTGWGKFVKSYAKISRQR
ncbi:MAG: peptidase C11 [Deltaproteobacteria bacterium]